MKASAIGSSAPAVGYDAYIDYAKEHTLDLPMPLAVSICMDVATDLGLKLKTKSESALVFRERLLLGGTWLTVRLTPDGVRTSVRVSAGMSVVRKKDPHLTAYVRALSSTYLTTVVNETQIGLPRVPPRKPTGRRRLLRAMALVNWLPLAGLMALGFVAVVLIAMDWTGLHTRLLSLVAPCLVVLFMASSIGRRRILGLSWRESIAAVHAVVALFILVLDFALTFLA